MKRLDVSGPLGSGVRGIIRGLLAEACAHLETAGATGDTQYPIHESRKAFKAARSHLRLLRPALGAPAQQANLQLRNAARALAPVRDNHALEDAIAALGPTAQRLQLDLTAVRRATVAERTATAPDAIGDATASAMANARACFDDIERWDLPDVQLELYLCGLELTYSGARRTLSRAFATGRAFDLHEARKRVIHWRYQLDLLAGIWPRVLRAEVRELQELRESLGRHNDLVLLLTALNSALGAELTAADRSKLADAIIIARSHCVRRARAQAVPMFAEPPSARIDRLASAWRAVRSNN